MGDPASDGFSPLPTRVVSNEEDRAPSSGWVLDR